MSFPSAVKGLVPEGGGSRVLQCRRTISGLAIACCGTFMTQKG